MVDIREQRRAETRKRRVIEKLGIDQREAIKHGRIGRLMDQLRDVVSDETFKKFAHTYGIQSVPSILDSQSSLSIDVDRSLAFVVSWRFFAPFLYDPVIATYMETRWPGLINEMKDVFISLVADGPFPHEPRGRDRRSF